MHSSQAEKAARFLRLHRERAPLLMPNAWDPGSAKVLAELGFEALATTSSAFAATLGRLDGSVTREEALAHCAALVAATELPVSADLENCFADDPAGVAETVGLALDAGLAGCSVEDYSGDPGAPIYELELAAERVAAAAAAAHAGEVHLVLTARAENLLHDHGDLEETITRLRAYERAGADVLFAPGLASAEQVRAVIEAVGLPVSVLARHTLPPVPELGALGVARVSVGGAFGFAALGAAVEAATELRDGGTYGFMARSQVGYRAARAAFAPPD